MGEFIIFDARFATGYRKVTRMMIEELELDVIERLKPYWDLAEIHFVGRFHMRFTPRRIVVSPSYELKVSLCFYDARDFDNFKIMTKLHDMPECLELDY